MRQRVISADVDTLRRPPLNGDQHSMVVLRSAVHDHRQSSDFTLELRIRKTELPPILRVRSGGARGARSDFIVDSLTVQEAVAAGITIAWNEDCQIQRRCRLQ